MRAKDRQEVYYREVQPFYMQGITWIGLLLFGGMVIWLAVEEMILDAAAVLVYIVLGLLLALTIFGKLVIEVRKREVRAQMIPFHRKGRVFTRDEMDEWTIVRYSPVRDYGGWGIRMGRNGTAYTVYGRSGLRLSLKGGKVVLIGTQQPENLKTALKKAGM